MGNNLERQLEKELEHFIQENWKWLLPVGGVVGAAWVVKRNSNKIIDFLKTIMPYIQTGVITLGSIGLIFLLFLSIRTYIVRKKEKENYTYYRILPRVGQEVKPHDVHLLMRQLSSVKRGRRKRFLKGREWLHYFMYHGEEGFSFYVGCPADLRNDLLQTFQNTYPESELHVASDVPLPSKGSFSGRMRVKPHRIKQWMPFTSYQSGDEVGNLLAYMPKHSWLSFAFSSESRKKIGKKLFRAEKEMKKDKKYSEMYSFQKEQFKDITGRLTGEGKVFKVAISMSGEGKNRRDIVKSIGKNVSSILNNKNLLLFKRQRNSITFCPHPRRKLLYLTNNELANLVHLPSMNHTISTSIPSLEKGQRHLDEKTLNKGVTIGYNLHPLVKERKVKIEQNQLTEHAFISGMTGSGKSSLIVMMLQSIIDEWLQNPQKASGFTFFDPAGTTVRTLLNRLQKAELEGKKVNWEKVIYVSFKNGEYPIAMNFFHKNEGEDTDTVVQNGMSLFKTIYTGDKTRIDKYLSNTITTLIDDEDDHNVLSINRFLTDTEFRDTIINRIQDELLRDFWRTVDLRELRTVSTDIYSRVNNFEQSLFMRRMFGQNKWDLPLKTFMDEGYIVLFDIQGLGRINTQFIVGHLLNQYHQVCQKRRAYASREHFLVVDESHLCQIPVIEKVIAEDRKFNLSLILSTQYFNQYQDWLRQAIDGNVQNIISGAQGGTESKIMADILMKKQFDADLIATLPNNTAAVLTKNSDKTLTTCLVKTEPPYLYKPDLSVVKHKDTNDINIVEAWIDEKASEIQSRIGRPASEIDEEIRTYFGFTSEEEEEQEEEFFEEPQEPKPSQEEDDFFEEANEQSKHTGGNEILEKQDIKQTESNHFPMESSLSTQKSGIIKEEKKQKEKKTEKIQKEVESQSDETFF
ncbi:hypothetical protein ABEY63_25580 [Priestia aryabhattai]|uniref:hypothetical protein n=1 Tax=Priestia aryabhattai TaxID=412384 RepID=UPI003D29AE8F